MNGVDILPVVEQETHFEGHWTVDDHHKSGLYYSLFITEVLRTGNECTLAECRTHKVMLAPLRLASTRGVSDLL